MAFTANVFTPSAIGAAILGEQEILENSRMAEFKQEIVAGQAILAHQDPRIDQVGFGEACMNAKIYTLRSGTTDKGDKAMDCEVTGGNKPGSEAITLTKSILVNLEEFAIDRGGGAGKETIGTGASVGLVGPGIYFLTVTNGGCATPKEAYYFQEQTSSRPIDITIQQASGFEFVITRVNLLLIDPAMYAVFVDGILVNYTASTPTLASEFTIAADGKLTFSESHPLDFSEIVIIDI